MYANIRRRSATVSASRVAADRRLLHLVEAPHLVEAEHVIGVAVGEEDRVDAADVVGQRLRAQVGGGVDQDRAHRARRTAIGGAPTCSSIRIDGRVRRSRGSVERQTAQSQPIAGTPCEVPVPRTVTRIGDGDGWV